MKEDRDTDKVGKKVGIIGLGFVGLPLALAFIHKGFRVIGIDLDDTKVNKLKDGISYIRSVEDEEISTAITANTFVVSSDYKDIKEAGTIIICVPTPLSQHHTPDLSFLTDTCYRLVPLLQKGQLIVLESSTYPGTTREVVQPILERSRLMVGKDMFLAYSPERIDPGNKELSIESIPKVIGGITQECLQKGCDLYRQVFDRIIPMSTTEAAETTKLLENTYRLVNISFINEFAILCDRMNINIWEIIDAASTKPYGFTAFYPSPGAGGHCIPVDPLYLQWKAKTAGVESQFIALAHQINEAMPNYIVEQLNLQLPPSKTISESRILIYGITYRKDVPDIRESTAIELIKQLKGKGAEVSYHDPLVPSLTIDGETMNSMEITESLLKSSDCVLIHTDHSEIPVSLIVSCSSLVFDARNATNNMKGDAKIVKLGGGLA